MGKIKIIFFDIDGTLLRLRAKELSEKTANSDGWKLMIEHEQKELEMLIEFINVLSK